MKEYIKKTIALMEKDKLAVKERDRLISRFVDIDNPLNCTDTPSEVTSIFSVDTRSTVEKPEELIVKDIIGNREELLNNFISTAFPYGLQWAKFVTRSRKKDNEKNVVEYLAAINEIVLREISNSNFLSEFQPAFLNAIDYGTGCLWAQKDGKGKVNYKFVDYHSLLLSDDNDGSVSRVAVSMRYTSENLSMFINQYKLKKPTGKDGQEVKFEAGEYHDVQLFFIKKNNFNKDKFKTKKKVACGLIINKFNYSEEIERGYNYMPILPFRYKKKSNPYGYGIGDKANSLSELINDIVKDLMLAGQTNLNYPKGISDDNVLSQLEPFQGRFAPGAVVYSPDIRRGQLVQRLVEEVNLPHTWDTVDRLSEKQAVMYHRDLFINDKKSRQTSGEIFDLKAQRNRALGTSTLNIFRELVIPVINILFEELKNSKSFPDPIKELSGEDIFVSVENQLLDSGGQQMLSDLGNLIQVIRPFLELEPKAGKKINVEEVVDIAFQSVNLGRALETDEEYKKANMREEEMQAGVESQQQDMAQSDIDNKNAQTDKLLTENANPA